MFSKEFLKKLRRLLIPEHVYVVTETGHTCDGEYTEVAGVFVFKQSANKRKAKLEKEDPDAGIDILKKKLLQFEKPYKPTRRELGYE